MAKKTRIEQALNQVLAVAERGNDQGEANAAREFRVVIEKQGKLLRAAA